MKFVLITGSGGLVGSEAAEFFSRKGFSVIGIDNNLRRYFFGRTASVHWNVARLKKELDHYVHYHVDVRNFKKLQKIFQNYSKDIKLVIHAAAQPSHDWAAKEPLTDFSINAGGTLNMLELTRQFCPKAVFIFLSTNKVYGDSPNFLPLRELKSRWELPKSHKFFEGIDETMAIDRSTHSLFGVSKAAADLLVQEYGRYFGMLTVSFRGGCLTGPHHAGAVLHGFLSYLMMCCVTGRSYTIYGYQGKQVRDNIHSYDLMNAFFHFYRKPRKGEVYNIGGGRVNSCSVLEAIGFCEDIAGKRMRYQYDTKNRIGDHIWYISSLKKFQSHYPRWTQKFSLKKTLLDIYHNNKGRWVSGNF